MKQRRLCIGLLILLLAAGGMSSGPARASATFAVNSTTDIVDDSPGDGVCETEAGNGVCTLRAAIQEANALAGADTITLPAGTYTLSLSGAGEDEATTGDLDISGALTISGTSAISTTIDGGLIDRVLEIDPGPISSGVAVTITGVLISNGSVAGAGGGILNNGRLTLTNVAISGNRASASGGGIYNFNGGDLTLVESVLSGNTAGTSEVGGNGGGINNFDSTATLANVTISGNTANGGSISPSVGNGGGIFSGAPGGGSAARMSLVNVTIADNSAGQGSETGDGGGIFISSGTFSVTNTLLARNTDAGGQAPDCAGNLRSGGYNLIQSTAGCAITGTLDSNLNGLDARIGDLSDNGGATLTHALLAGSPALDAGSNGVCAAPPVGNRDQRGAARPFDGEGNATATCDIGAYEAQAVLRAVYLPLIAR